MRDAPSRICPICGRNGTLLHEGVRDRLFGVPGQWNFRLCDDRSCGLVWLDPRPLESDLHEAYAVYYTHGDNDSGNGGRGSRGSQRRIVDALEQIWLSALFLRSARQKIETMFLDGVVPGRLLEVGCGEGRLLARLQGQGWRVEGQDLDAKAADNARRAYGLTVHLGELETLGLPAESYDAIVMNHVIEHAYDPVALVRECRRLLKPGGLFVATTPNPESYGHRRFGPAWRGLDPPRHLHLITPSAFAQIASAANLERIQVWTSPARAGGMLAASLDIERSGRDPMGGRATPFHLAAACIYQLVAQVVHFWRRSSGEEAVLRAWK
jgi:2-polyprenyl-3-methyl-5-hydroxy-6-metoxy-1,4-benzoquinol methylase